MIEVFHILKDEIEQDKSIVIYTDSEYVVKCCTSFGVKCEKDNWTKKKGEIPNVELVKEVYSLYKQYENVQVEWIRAHTNDNDELRVPLGVCTRSPSSTRLSSSPRIIN